MAERLRIPNSWKELSIKVAQLHSSCHRAAELKPSTLLSKLEQIDALRRPEELEAFLLACEADARGRKGHEEEAYPQADIFRRACAAAMAVDSSGIALELRERGGNGEAIGRMIREARIAAIAKSRTKSNGQE